MQEGHAPLGMKAAQVHIVGQVRGVTRQRPAAYHGRLPFCTHTP